MKKLLKHMKLIYLIFLILGGVVLISALPFKTQYNMVYVNVDSTGIQNASAGMTNAEDQDQQLLWDYYEAKGENFNDYRETVYDFEQSLNTTNYLILYFGIAMLVGVAVLYLLQNPNRKIYYASNVVGSVIVTLGIAVFAVIVLLKIFGLMGDLGKNSELFNTVALLQNPNTRAAVSQMVNNPADVQAMFTVNSATLVAYMIGLVVCIVYALFVMVLTFAKFKRTKERRSEILSKAVENND